ncbi:hypothetical protein BDB01DRAFT_726943 [Pilobolus umbonatus]|nr:hypothetical protein BDB01DRAFT_726943 [Pilobolus umbonatus]
MDRTILILYGSETGCAQDVAESLGRQSRRHHFKTRVMAMDDYDKNQLIEEKLVLFVCSTTGEGVEPSNMKHFWKFLLRKNLPGDILGDLECAVVGLGDSSYRKFNYPSKKLYKRLLQLGAKMIAPRCDCDDQHYLGLDGALGPWSNQFWEIIMRKYPPTIPIISNDILYPFQDHTNNVQPSKQRTLPGEYDLTVKKNERITASDHFQDVRHIELVSSDDTFKYEPGDIAVITPQNLVADVDTFLEFMGWADVGDRAIKVSAAEDHTLPQHWPSVMKFKDLFIYYLDIFGVPRRSFFEMLSYFTLDSNHTERLREFTTPEGQEDMWAYSMRPRRTMAETLFDFKPFSIPHNYILELFPQLQPRSFSIASSLSVHPSCMELCIAIVKYKTKMRKIRRGVCSKWISQIKEGDTIPRVRITRGTMTLPPANEIPLIAIGPAGTGIAPMRAFIEERVFHGASNNVLIVGCRHRDKDYYYRDQWNQYRDQHQLQVITAFSRDQEQKIYVQDRIRENSVLLWDMIENEGAKVVLSGSSNKMPEEVAYAFKQIFMKEGKLSAQEAEEYFDGMIKSRQYQEECWA